VPRVRRLGGDLVGQAPEGVDVSLAAALGHEPASRLERSGQPLEQALVIGDRRPYLTALITLDEAETAKLGESADTEALVQEIVDEWNRDKASFEQVKRFEILPRDFSAEEDEVTPTMKLRRKIVVDHFGDQIEALYAR